MDAGTKPDDRASDGHPDPAALLAAGIDRVAEAYRRMPHSKFTLRIEPYGDRESAGRWLVGQYAALAQGIEQWDRTTPPDWIPVPSLGAFALGDQVAVTGRELLAAYHALKDPSQTLVWTPGGGRLPADKALAAVLEGTTAVRKLL
jgi:hypothetical protein